MTILLLKCEVAGCEKIVKLKHPYTEPLCLKHASIRSDARKIVMKYEIGSIAQKLWRKKKKGKLMKN